ncbi:MAG: TolC family protein [Candidatus Eremiobacteraeota bacterium]|nr:TolC family protein [Candidatus Eremiobacteraeota bacterium]
MKVGLIAIILLLAVKSCCWGEAMRLEECIATALANNLDIKQEALVLNISMYQERAVRSLFYPTLSLIGYDIYLKNNPIMSRYGGAIMKQPLYTGGKLSNDVLASRENKNAKAYNLRTTELFVENQVFDEYMNCLRYWKFCKAYEDALEKAVTWLESVRDEVKAGKRGNEDILRWQVLIDTYKENLVNARKNKANSEVRLNTLMNRNCSEPIEVTDSHNLRFEYADFMIRQKIYTEEQMLEMYNDYALIFSPEYKKKLSEVLVANYSLLSEEATVKPTVDILSNYYGRSLPIAGMNSSWDTGLYMSFDLYKQQKYENIKISKLQLELSKVKEQTYLRNLRSDVRTLYTSNASNNEKVSIQRKQQKTSRQYLRDISERYRKGTASNLDVVEGFNSFYSNQVALVDSIYNAFSEYANLLNRIGFSFLYTKPAPNLYWRYREHGLKLDYDLKALDDPAFRFMDDSSLEKVKAFLMGNPSLIKAHDRTGQTALHYAIDRGYVKYAEFLLSKGADPNAVNYLDGTPMVRAICFCPPEGRLAMVNMLIKYGADVNRVSHHYTPLCWAAMKNYLDEVKALVLAGAQVNGRDAYLKNTPLHFSAFWGKVEMARFLLEHGADPSLENADGLTASDLAWQFEHWDLVKFLETWESGGSRK